MPGKKRAGRAGGSAGAAAKKPARAKAARAAKKARAADTAAAAPATAALRVKQIRSGIGHAGTYRRTLEALGLKYHQDEVVVRDHPAVRGMLRKVWNFVSVRPVEG
jgi:ribosomal protein L30